MTEFVLTVWIMSLNPAGGIPTYVTEKREMGTYQTIGACEPQRDALMAMTKVEQGAVTIVCVPRDSRD